MTETEQTIWCRNTEFTGQTITDIEKRKDGVELGICDTNIMSMDGQTYRYNVERWPDDPKVWVVVM